MDRKTLRSRFKRHVMIAQIGYRLLVVPLKVRIVERVIDVHDR